MSIESQNSNERPPEITDSNVDLTHSLDILNSMETGGNAGGILTPYEETEKKDIKNDKLKNIDFSEIDPMTVSFDRMNGWLNNTYPKYEPPLPISDEMKGKKFKESKFGINFPFIPIPIPYIGSDVTKFNKNGEFKQKEAKLLPGIQYTISEKKYSEYLLGTKFLEKLGIRIEGLASPETFGAGSAIIQKQNTFIATIIINELADMRHNGAELIRNRLKEVGIDIKKERMPEGLAEMFFLSLWFALKDQKKKK